MTHRDSIRRLLNEVAAAETYAEGLDIFAKARGVFRTQSEEQRISIFEEVDDLLQMKPDYRRPPSGAAT
jgi:hypothetical protein